MERLGQYVLSVTSAAITLGILLSLLKHKSSSELLVRLIGGVFLAFTAIAPVAEIDLDVLFDPALDFAVEGDLIAAHGQEIVHSQMRDIIKDRCEAYILDKALTYQTPVDVEVELNQDQVPVPTSVQITGNVSPYAKNLLQKWLEDDMGIPRENQLWIG